MVGDSRYIVVSGNQLLSIKRSQTVAGLLRRYAETKVIVIKGDVNILDPLNIDENSISDSFADYTGRFQIRESDSAVTGIQSAVLPRVTEANETSLLVGRSIASSRLCLIEFSEVLTLSVPWPVDRPQLTLSSLTAALNRQTPSTVSEAWPQPLILLAEYCAQFDLALSRMEVRELCADVMNALTTQSTEVSAPQSIRDLMNLRSRISAVRDIARGCSIRVTNAEQEVEAQLHEIDSFTNGATNILLYDLEARVAAVEAHDRAAAQRTAEFQQQHANSELLRDRQISRFAAAFLLPTIWFSFLGINLIPPNLLGYETQGAEAVLGAFVFGLVFSVLGWLIVPKLVKSAKVTDK